MHNPDHVVHELDVVATKFLNGCFSQSHHLHGALLAGRLQLRNGHRNRPGIPAFHMAARSKYIVLANTNTFISNKYIVPG